MKARKEILSYIVSSALVSLVACTGLTPTPVHNLLQNPRDYEGKSVLISGRVMDRSSLLVSKSFVLKDKTGEIRVFTDRALPIVGANLRVRGHVRQPFVFGNTDIVVFDEDAVNAQD
jgi:hypothetical protein